MNLQLHYSVIKDQDEEEVMNVQQQPPYYK